MNPSSTARHWRGGRFFEIIPDSTIFEHALDLDVVILRADGTDNAAPRQLLDNFDPVLADTDPSLGERAVPEGLIQVPYYQPQRFRHSHSPLETRHTARPSRQNYH